MYNGLEILTGLMPDCSKREHNIHESGPPRLSLLGGRVIKVYHQFIIKRRSGIDPPPTVKGCEKLCRDYGET